MHLAKPTTLALLLPLFAQATAAAAEKVVLESLQGKANITVVRQVQSGSELRDGDQIRTGSDESLRISYPDGSQLLVGSSTNLEIRTHPDGVPSNFLASGHVRAVVAKPKINIDKKHRFYIRTRTAVMGVRGTDFTVDTDESGDSAEVHTLEGKVEAAPDEKTLASDKAVAIEQGQMVKVKERTIAEPKAFDRDAYLSQLAKSQPGVTELMQKMPPVEQKSKPKSKPKPPADADKDPLNAPKMKTPKEVR